MPDIERLVADYCRAWFDPDPAERRRLLSAVFEPDGVYTDPKTHVVGVDALLRHIDGVIAARDGFYLELTTRVDAHHDFIRFGWVQRGANGFRGADSIDIARLSPDGKFSLIVGFFGPMTALGG